LRDNASEKDGDELLQFIESASRNFMNTELALGLQAAGVELERSDNKSNYERSHRMFMGQAKSHDDRELTIMGRGVYGEAATSEENRTSQTVHINERDTAMKNKRLYEVKAEAYLETISALPNWHYWQQKAWDAREDPKARNEVGGLVETLTGYASNDPSGFRSDVNPAEFKKFREPMLEILEEWNQLMMALPKVTIEDKLSWEPRMNWNRNGGHPFHLNVPKERFDTVDWPNFRDFLTRGVKILDPELIGEFMDAAPINVQNANDNVYTMFTRSPDRVIHGIRLLMKPYGAMMTAVMTPTLRNSDISWISVDQMQSEAAAALADASCISADDLKKFDKSLHPEWFTLIYNTVIESNFLSHAPQIRAALLILLYDLTRENVLRVHSSWIMRMFGGLPSGHGLTQWIGSLIHLVLYRYWKNTLSLEPKWQKVLSDDGIQIFDDISPDEMAGYHVTMGEDLALIGMELHPDKTKIADPTVEIYIGQLNGEEMYMHDSTYFLKRNLQRDKLLSHGNSCGVNFYDTERAPTDKAIQEASLREHILGYEDIMLGGKPPRAIYDLARTVDVLAACGPGNPLVEDHINLIQNAWPGFQKRGRRILVDQLDDSWRDGTYSYAGGTLDSGLSRRWAVEALLNDSDGYKVWDELVFRN
jgi:hypothetical protein